MKPLLSALLGFLIVFSAACGDDDLSLPMDGGPDAEPSSVQPIFQPTPDPMPFGAVPFPDDLYLDDTGHVALAAYPGELESFSTDYFEPLREGWATLDGFSVVAPIFFPLNGLVDPATLPSGPDGSLAEDASVFLIDADAGSASAYTRVPAAVHWSADEQLISLRPSAALIPGHRYAAVLTSSVRDMLGQPIAPSAAFAEVRGATAPTDALLAEAHALYDPVLANVGVARTDVVGLAVFRVQSATDDLALVREQMQSETPTLNGLRVRSGEELDMLLGEPLTDAIGKDVEGGIVHDAIGYVVDGFFDAPNYLNERENVHGRFERTDSGQVAVKRIDQVPFTMTLPAGVAAPPIVIFQHGVTSERSDIFGVANTLAEAGYATVAIDAPWHGLRAARPTVDTEHAFSDAEGPDGFGDVGGMGIIVDFAGLTDPLGDYVGFHPFYLRDALRQSAADLVALVRVLRSSDWTGLAELEPELEGLSFAESRLAFIGHSLGGIIGTLFVGVESEVGAAVLAVTGGNVTLTVQDSYSFNGVYLGQLFPLLGLDVGGVDYAAREPLLYPGFALWQGLLDAGDSVSYAARLRERPIDLLMQMVRDDETVPNRSTETLARAMGIPAVGGESGYVALPTGEAPLRGNVMVGDEATTRGLYIYESGAHGTLLRRQGTQRAEHPPLPPFVEIEDQPIDNPIDATHAQIVSFLESWRAGGAEISAIE